MDIGTLKQQLEGKRLRLCPHLGERFRNGEGPPPDGVVIENIPPNEPGGDICNMAMGCRDCGDRSLAEGIPLNYVILKAREELRKAH